MRILLALSVVLALAGCGTGKPADGVASANGSSGSAAPSSAAAQGDMASFAKCMRENGVNMPDPDPDGGPGAGADSIDRNSPAFQKAMDACKQHLPGGGDLSKLDPKLVDQLREFTKCMRDNGVNVPDPDPSSPMLGLGAMADLDRGSPAVQKAMEACKDKVPGRPGK
ncbi:hypothetical protein [Actinocrispum sp. NPDC049592]|uniref:hypothetical protein n=1 Tax=Actinocrispum sp. NPDC049592 TaxID=3154835 RepID=UPI003422FE6D